MSSSASDADHLPKLPDDVVVDHILKRLPVRSLLRFRCVCRSWRSTIDGPRFVALHLNHSALHAGNWHLAYLDWDDLDHRLCSLLSGESLARASMSQIEIPFAGPRDCFVFPGSCNGLICIMEVAANEPDESIYVWNLFTRKHKAVPRFGPAKKFLSMEKTMEGLGFGFDARSNDHKIVRILQDVNRKGLETRVQIYTLSTDSWRSLECEVPALCNPIPAVFLNGNLHWFVSKHTEGYGSVLLFDVASEVFDEMVPSEEFLHVLSVSSEAVLSVLNDLLAVCTIRGEAVGHPKPLSVCSIWVMREYGVPESWTELYSFEYSGRVSGVDGFTRDGELLMLTADKGQVSWNPITGQFAILSLPRCCDWVTVVESLVSL
ncbi:hypothetical protein ACJRO7_033819 [Eucalyptus globulus]|uniref:F-box domain-containing protein n=1 Tax=Eucalyptus globulus TaxID=34317 RepID=A0ABD3J7B5_EUCGL